MSKPHDKHPGAGKGRQFHAVSIRKIENGWVSSTTTGDANGARSTERFHVTKPVLGAGLAKTAPAAKAPSRSRAAAPAAKDTYRDPAQRPKPVR